MTDSSSKRFEDMKGVPLSVGDTITFETLKAKLVITQLCRNANGDAMLWAEGQRGTYNFWCDEAIKLDPQYNTRRLTQ